MENKKREASKVLRYIDLFDNAVSLAEPGEDRIIGADDVAINVVLGAWLNRKGVGRTYDLTPKNFNSNINIMRKAMNNLGIKGENVYRIPTFDPKQAPHASAINNDVKLKEIFKDFEDRGNKFKEFAMKEMIKYK